MLIEWSIVKKYCWNIWFLAIRKYWKSVFCLFLKRRVPNDPEDLSNVFSKILNMGSTSSRKTNWEFLEIYKMLFISIKNMNWKSQIWGQYLQENMNWQFVIEYEINLFKNMTWNLVLKRSLATIFPYDFLGTTLMMFVALENGLKFWDFSKRFWVISDPESWPIVGKLGGSGP